MEINIKKYQWMIIVSTILLLVIGVYMVRESSLIWSEYLYKDQEYYFKSQLIYALIGLFVFFISIKINYKYLYKFSTIFLLVSIVLLILVLIPGVGIKRNGSTSWLGFSLLTFQPSEFFKISLILFISHYLNKEYIRTSKLKNVLPLILIMGIGFTLIMLQPDFGTCMVLAISVFALLYSSRLKNKWFAIFILIGFSFIAVLIMSASYRFSRIMSFIDPFEDPLGSGFQIIQSLYALGPGGLIGNLESIQKHFYLPEPQTDFIFAIFIEEFGLLGGLILLVLYGIIFYSSYMIIKNSKSLFKSFVSLGLLCLFIVQVIINLGVVIGLFPVTGITLPLISYGGSSLIVCLFSLGLIVNNNYEKDIIS